MQINLQKIGKKFNREWVFKNIDFEILAGSKLSVLGSNGSGKSTLLQVISGILSASEGCVEYTVDDKIIPVEEV